MDLTAAFHIEMRELATDHAQMMAVADFMLVSGVTMEEVDAGQTVMAQAFQTVRTAYFQTADELFDRFSAAGIGDWNDHMEKSGARKIIDDDLVLRP